jgi:aspartyl-tRNA(Asn)/glutamyl-tRNA(Gln) amidotransferase subunit B
MSDKPVPYTIVIGLETHVQLQTESKLFCGCSTKFGAPPNTQTCPICTGHPGTLPVMNARAFELALQTAVALNCQIATYTKWDRKQYYYPDLPKGYQISQYDLPFSFAGHLDISDPKGKFAPRRVRITRAHLEEDAGKSMHDEHAGRGDSTIDLNRTGTPLLEIVTEPDMRSPAEAKAYLTELKLLLTYLGVSDCNMQEGSLRVDANVNLWIDEEGVTKKTPIVEIKNMNSFRAVEKAIAYEAERQYGAWQDDGKQLGDPGVFKRTFGWDDVKGKTYVQREKEESADYRYFPDPDLMPVTVSPERVAAVQSALGEVPAALRTRLETTFGITAYDSDVIVNQGREFVEYFLAVAQDVGDGKTVSNWLQQDVLRVMSENNHATIAEYPVQAERLSDLLKKVKAGDVDTSRGREVLQRMYDTGEDAAAAMAALGIEKVDESALIALCEEMVAANPKLVADVKGGKMQAAGAFVGQAKKKNPNANPGRVRELCLEIIAKLS